MRRSRQCHLPWQRAPPARQPTALPPSPSRPPRPPHLCEYAAPFHPCSYSAPHGHEPRKRRAWCAPLVAYRRKGAYLCRSSIPRSAHGLEPGDQPRGRRSEIGCEAPAYCRSLVGLARGMKSRIETSSHRQDRTYSTLKPRPDDSSNRQWHVGTFLAACGATAPMASPGRQNSVGGVLCVEALTRRGAASPRGPDLVRKRSARVDRSVALRHRGHRRQHASSQFRRVGRQRQHGCNRCWQSPAYRPTHPLSRPLTLGAPISMPSALSGSDTSNGDPTVCE